MKRIIMLLLLSMNIVFACSSCDVVNGINQIHNAKSKIYRDQAQTFINIKMLNASYLLHLFGINFEINRQTRLINLINQSDLKGNK